MKDVDIIVLKHTSKLIDEAYEKIEIQKEIISRTMKLNCENFGYSHISDYINSKREWEEGWDDL